MTNYEERFICWVDLRLGYHRFRVKKDDILKIPFTTRCGQYDFLVILFTLTYALTTFMNLMNRDFKQSLDMFVIVSINDIFIHSVSSRIVLPILKGQELFAKFRTCEVCLRSVTLFWHIVSSKGIEVYIKRTDAVKSWPRP